MPARRTGRESPRIPLPTRGDLLADVRPEAVSIPKVSCAFLAAALPRQTHPRRNRVPDYLTNLVVTRGERRSKVYGGSAAAAHQSGNLVPVSCSDSSQSAVAVVARFADQLRHVGCVRPYRPNRGPTNVLPGRSCATAYNVCRAPKSASVETTRSTAITAASVNLRPVWPCRFVRDQPGCAASARSELAAVSRRRCSSLVNSRLASFDWP